MSSLGQRSPGANICTVPLLPSQHPLAAPLTSPSAAVTADGSRPGLGPRPGPRPRPRPRGLTDGGDEGGVEGVFAEPEQQAGLPDAAVTDQQQLEQIVICLGHLPAACPGSSGTETEPPVPSRRPRPADTPLETVALLGALVRSRSPLTLERAAAGNDQTASYHQPPPTISAKGFSQ